MNIPVLFSLPAVLAAAGKAPNIKDLPDYSRGSRLLANDMVIVFGVIILLALTVVVWIVFVRGPRKHPEVANRKPLGVDSKPEVTVTEDGRERHRKKKRVRRRDHRQRNPTLDQTGGLPPPRDPQETPSV